MTMVKQRMTTADVAAEVSCLRLRGLIGMRVANIYDVNSKTYILKLARSGDDGEKVYLLIESGVRFHTIDAMPSKNDVPSNFSMKLRKHIRTRRLESIVQLGVDRMVRLSFGSGDTMYHLILEMYDKGNVVLVDSKYIVLSLLRSHRDDAKSVAIMPGHLYAIQTVRLFRTTTKDVLMPALSSAQSQSEDSSSLKDVLQKVLPYGLLVTQHCIVDAGLAPERQLHLSPLSEDECDVLLDHILEWEKWLQRLATTAPGGIILCKQGTAVYDEFQPLLGPGKTARPLAQHRQKDYIAFETFDLAMKEFFGSMATQRAATEHKQREKAALSKVEVIQKENEKRLHTLAREAEANERKAGLIEQNVDAVDAALNAVKEALAAGLDWRELASMIKTEKKAGNPVAALVDSLQLEDNKITVLLPVHTDDGDDGEEEVGGKVGEDVQNEEKVQVNLDLSAHANARSYYDSRKKHMDKRQRTVAATEIAVKAAEKRAAQAVAKQQGRKGNVALSGPARKQYWFEKFNWFISSENYLVLSGRDAQQNELLVKRYLVKGDVYVHADLHGASTSIVKNHTPESPIPALTLTQAGQACVCRSAAWDAKVVTSAWWVHPEQVSKSAPTGEFLTTGSFMVRGRKNFLPPQPLVMGFGILFKLDEESIAAHLGERAVRKNAAHEETDRADDDDDDDDSGADTLQHEVGDEDVSSHPVSAYEAFLDSSANVTLQKEPVESITAAFDRYGLCTSSDVHKDKGQDAVEEEENPVIKSLLSHRVGTSKGTGKNILDTVNEKQKTKNKKKQEDTQKASFPLDEGDSIVPTQRGKKSKQLQAKYRHQDEEERAIAMALLQPAGQKKDKQMKKEERKARMSARKMAHTGLPQRELTEDEIQQLTARPEKTEAEGEVEADTEEVEEPASSVCAAAEEERKRNPVQSNTCEKEEVAALLADENIDVVGEDVKVSVLDSLTGCPRQGDTLLFALPVCAPYSVLSSYKHKVKLVPGTLRKGKAAKQSLDVLFKASEGREKELIRLCPEQAGIDAIIGSCRLQMPGLQKIQQKGKKKK